MVVVAYFDFTHALFTVVLHVVFPVCVIHIQLASKLCKPIPAFFHAKAALRYLNLSLDVFKLSAIGTFISFITDAAVVIEQPFEVAA